MWKDDLNVWNDNIGAWNTKSEGGVSQGAVELKTAYERLARICCNSGCCDIDACSTLETGRLIGLGFYCVTV